MRYVEDSATLEWSMNDVLKMKRKMRFFFHDPALPHLRTHGAVRERPSYPQLAQ